MKMKFKIYAIYFNFVCMLPIIGATQNPIFSEWVGTTEELSRFSYPVKVFGKSNKNLLLHTTVGPTDSLVISYNLENKVSSYNNKLDSVFEEKMFEPQIENLSFGLQKVIADGKNIAWEMSYSEQSTICGTNKYSTTLYNFSLFDFKRSNLLLADVKRGLIFFLDLANNELFNTTSIGAAILSQTGDTIVLMDERNKLYYLKRSENFVKIQDNFINQFKVFPEAKNLLYFDSHRKLLYVITEYGYSNDNTPSGIYKIELETSRVEFLKINNLFSAYFSEESKQIFFTTNDDGNSTLYSIKLE